jgi:aryl-alcohol dehydrogenase-like predicted oxidoreductase
LVTRGLVKYIGVSNFSIKQIKQIYNATKYLPLVNQIEVDQSLSCTIQHQQKNPREKRHQTNKTNQHTQTNIQFEFVFCGL